jgi:hypothetical protein
MTLEDDLFGSDATAKRAAVDHYLNQGKEGLMNLLLLILEHIYDLENA